MSERYDQQEGAPQERPDSGETVNDSAGARPATIGERSTEDKVAGQGLGQMKNDDIKHRAPEMPDEAA
ncbi:MAG TPA: hypothetical protein VJS44_00440 [Pyrinomonadaceae bacterium]|nr:hypothetical protein [Pyrinomonadaceae bacterium]